MQKKSYKGNNLFHQNLLVLFCLALIFSPFGTVLSGTTGHAYAEGLTEDEEADGEEISSLAIDEEIAEEIIQGEEGKEEFVPVENEKKSLLPVSAEKEDSDEKAGEEITIIAISELADITMKVGEELDIPGTVDVTLSNGNKHEAFLDWGDFSEPNFDENNPGVYIFTGNPIIRGIQVSNPKELFATQKVIVESENPVEPEPPKNIDKEIAKISVTGTVIGIGELELKDVLLLFPSKETVVLDDESKIELEMVWNATSNPAYDKNKVGAYIFTGEFVLPEGIANSNNYTKEFWVNVVDFDNLIDPTEPTDPVEPTKPTEPTKPNAVDKDKVKDKEANKIKKDDDEDKDVIVTAVDDSNKLPKTATSSYTILFTGLLLMLLGGVSYFSIREEQVVKGVN